MTPAVARRNSVTAERPDEQPLFRREIGRDGLARCRGNEPAAPPVRPSRSAAFPASDSRKRRRRFACRRRANATDRRPSPGSSRRFGLRARHATSVPETTDWRKKFATSATIERKPVARPNRRQKAQAHPGRAGHGGDPDRKVSNAHPEIISQNARKNTARAAATRARLRESRCPPARSTRRSRTMKRTATSRSDERPRNEPGCENSAHAHRPNGSAFAIQASLLRRGRELPCSFERGKRWSASLGAGPIGIRQ